MKYRLPIFALSAFAAMAIAGCSAPTVDPSGKTASGGSATSVSVSDTPSVSSVDNSGDFKIVTSDGTYSQSGNVYTITASGIYLLSGVLSDGQILVASGESGEVTIELSGATISCSSDSPIKVTSAEKLDISAKSGTVNGVYDKRSAKTVENAELGEGAISANCDLKLKGSGSLVVEGNYNNGVHTSKDLTIQKENLYVTGLNNAIKGKDSITVVSGDITAISQKGDGLKTDNTDLSSSGKQRGTITISGGTLFVDSASDALDASFDIVINEDNVDEEATDITIKTGKYSTYSSNYSSSGSAKGLKAANNISIEDGSVTIQASDDAIHANYGDAFDSGAKGEGTVSISGGTVGVASGDDGIHADNTLTISGGEITVSNAAEGIETNHLEISGGSTYIRGSDDGVNASRKIGEVPTVVVSGGFLDVQVTSGDTDGIDSNGNFTQTGGFIVSRGSPNNASGMSTGLDCDGTATISGGTFIAFNGVEAGPKTGSDVLYAYYGNASGQFGPRNANSSYKFASGTYTLTGGNLSKTFYNEYSYSAFLIYSNELSLGTTYTLNNGSSAVLSWAQDSSSVVIS